MELTPQFALLVPIVVGLVHVAKKYGLPSKWAPLLSLVVGIGIAVGLDGVTVEVALSGVVAGLTASGLWSGTKATIQ
jgi:hypothetical protein